MIQVLSWLYLLACVACVIDAARFSYPAWRAVGRNKNFWLPALFFLGIIFVLPYLVLVRPRLKTARIVLPKAAQ